MALHLGRWVRRLGWLAGGGVLLQLVMAGSVHADSVPQSSLQPAIVQAQGGQCVADPAFMRRNHMKLLKHQRDDTMRGGIRGGAYSLKECVACHASPLSRSVTAQPGDFCRSCHEYAAVRIDCFECHANRPAGVSPHTAVVQSQAKP